MIREFDLKTKSFVKDGFTLPEAKSDASYIDDDSVLFASDFGKGSLTTSGYARIVKLWTRGEPVADAKTIFEGKKEDVLVAPMVFHGADGTVPLIVRAVTFFQSEYFAVHARRQGGEIAAAAQRRCEGLCERPPAADAARGLEGWRYHLQTGRADRLPAGRIPQERNGRQTRHAVHAGPAQFRRTGGDGARCRLCRDLRQCRGLGAQIRAERRWHMGGRNHRAAPRRCDPCDGGQ